MSSEILIEVCVDSVQSAVAAERGGAARIELCSGVVEGGLTPSAGLLEMTRAKVSIPVHVMIRPRGGDFCYDDDEFETMQRDIVLAKQFGASGVVLGILDANAHIDFERMRLCVSLARPLEVTFHRAFDMTADPFSALEELCALKVNRVLTSGGEQTSPQGATVIAQLIERARGRITVMPGSGIKPGNARDLVRQTGAREIHVGLRTAAPSPVLHQNLRISMGAIPGREYQRFHVLEENVRSLGDALAGVSAG